MNKVKTVGVNYLNEVVRLSLEVCVIIWLLKTKKRDNLSTLSRFVPEVGIEPTLLAEHEFESCASTSSAIRANGDNKSNLE